MGLRIDLDYRERDTDRHLALARIAMQSGWESIRFKDLELDMILYSDDNTKSIAVEIKTIDDLWASVRSRLKGQLVRASVLDMTTILLILGGIDDIFDQKQLKRRGKHCGGVIRAAGMMHTVLAEAFASGFIIMPLSTKYERSFGLLLSSAAAWFDGRDLVRWSPKGVDPHRLFFESLPGIGRKTSEGLLEQGYHIQVVGPDGRPVTADQLDNVRIGGRCIGTKAKKILCSVGEK